jgi:hypothetical protein
VAHAQIGLFCKPQPKITEQLVAVQNGGYGS